MIHKIERTRKILRMLYNALFMLLVFMFVSVVFLKLHPPVFVYLVIMLAYLLSYIIRDYAPSNLWILILHTILCGTIIPIRLYMSIKILLITVIIHLMGDAFTYARYGYKLRPLDDMPWPTFLISIIIYTYGFFMHENIMTKSAYFIPVILLVLYYVMIYVEGLRTYVNATKDVSGLPLKRIVSTNTMIVFMIIIFLILGIWLGNILELDEALKAVGKGAIALFKFLAIIFVTVWKIIASFFSSGGGSSTTAIVMEDKAVREYAGQIGDSFEFALKGGIILLATYIVYKITIKIIKRLVEKRKFATDIIEQAEVSYKDTKKEVLYRRIFKIKKTPEEKIRKYYRLRIMKNKYQISLTKSKTAEDIRKEIKANELGNVDDITRIYSDVRYGKISPDKNMVKKMNHMIKQ